MDYPILSKITSPEDVKALSDSEIQPLCAELRDCIISTVAKNGGHLASNLGAVELTVALHRSFSSPEDAIIFDVGHQCYTHKLLTGRFNEFHTLRTVGGLSGFMRPDESIHDPFITGHSSNSVSAAYGIYKAKRLKGESGTAVAVIGDGALTGGMAYEALNNAGSGRSNFIVVLNDNKMSISRNVGALARSLTKMRNKPRYHNFKYALSHLLTAIPLVGDKLNLMVFKAKEAIKDIVYKSNIFSAMGFNYLGPVDGHNVKELESLFKIAKGYNRPSLIHVITTKGKGYSYAEVSPKNYHGVSSFDIDEGASFQDKPTFSATAGKALCDLAEKDEKICAVTAAMTEGTGLSEFATVYKSRFFDVGIAEQHAVAFSAALAKEGLKPYFAVYSSFLQRAYDQLVHDTAIGGFPLRLLIDRAGIVGEDGETHQGLFDVSFLTSIPDMTVFSPASFAELEYRINASQNADSPCAIRYPRGGEGVCAPFDLTEDYSVIAGGGTRLIITYGRLYSEACKAKTALPELNILKLNKIYPLSDSVIEEALKYEKIDFYEEAVKSGGIAEHFAARLLEKGYKGSYKINAVDNCFVSAKATHAALSEYGLCSEAMINEER